MTLSLSQEYRKDLKYPDRLKSGFYRGYGHPSVKHAPATRDWHAIKSILIHTTNNPHGNTAYPQEARFLRDSAAVSINHVVSSHDQTIVEVLPPAFIAWHAGDCQDNDYENLSSIGIEIAWTPSAGPLPQIAIDNVTRLVRQLLEWYPWIRKIDMHRSQATPKGRKIDPSGWSDRDFYAWRAGIFGSVLPTPDSQPITEDASIISPPRATPEQCIARILARPHGEYTTADIGTIVRGYFATCQPVGVDPLVCIAQMIHETGNLSSPRSQRPQRNPAGIGATNDGAQGVSFATWKDDAIPAHVGRLVAYALPASQWSKAQHDLVVQALEYRTLPTMCWGSAPTLRELGSGPNEVLGCGWASPGLDYGAKIAAIMNQIRGV